MPPASTILVRPATPADLPAILEIYNEAVLATTATYDYEPATLAERTAWFEAHTRDRYPVFVGTTEAGDIVGWGALNRYRARPGYRFTTENSVYVAAPWRGRGVGRRLLGVLIQAARERGCHVILAAIDSQSAASLHLHAAFGFETVGHFKEVGFKFDRWLDVVFMQLRL